MLSSYLKGNIQFKAQVDSWEDSIKQAALPLLEAGNINPQYIDDMINNVNENGPYIVIVPGFALPHAKNEGGVIKTGISMLKLEQPVKYPEEKEVSILMVLAAEDSEGHLDLISDLSSLLVDDDIMEQFLNASSEEEVIKLIDQAE